jgi:hypothetical protein
VREQSPAGNMVRAHTTLSKLIAPAQPNAILILEEERAKTALGRLLGPVRLVRQLTTFSLLTLLAFVVLVAFTDANEVTALQEVSNSDAASSTEKLTAALYFLSAAGLGAAFAGLFRVSKYIDGGTYDPKYESSYWILIVLGLIAGIVLAHLLPDSFEGFGTFTKPLLALIGGFSAPAVHLILERLVETIKTVVQGDAATATASALESEARLRAREVKAETRLQVVNHVANARAELNSLNLNDEQRQSVSDLFDSFLPQDVLEGP